MTKDSVFLNGYIDNKSLIFFVNGKKVIEDKPDTECTLLTYLRNKLYLCGTKLGCGEGGCGACTVMISKIDRRTNEIKHFSANACLTPVCSVHGMAVTTVEGIGNIRTRLHPVQERIAKAHGSQCGFCTPGIVMSMYSLLRNKVIPSMKDIEIAFQGNLCRCTGYRPIIEAYKTFTDKYACAMGENCCKVNGTVCNSSKQIDDKLFEKSEFQPYDPSQEPIFPPELKVSDILDRESLIFKGERVIWYRPTTLEEILHLKTEYPHAKIVVGNTEVGVEVKFKHFLYPVLIQPSQIKEMNSIVITSAGIKVGASVTLTEIENLFKQQIDERPEHETRLYQCVVDMLHYFAGNQIRNVASIGGNIMTGSPISDMNPILMASEVILEVASLKQGFRKIRMNGEFFTGYRKNIVKPEEVLISVFFPLTNRNQHIVAYKQAKRRDDDIAIVNCAFNIYFKPETNVLEKINMAFGGIAPTTISACKTANAIKDKIWNKNLVETVANLLCKEFPLSPSAPGGMVSYRQTLIISLFFKAYLAVSQKLIGINAEQQFFGKEEKSGADTFFTREPKSTQLFEKPSDSQSISDPVGRPCTHISALKQATGEAVYCDDIPKMDNELYLALVLSSKAYAKILSIDPTEALKMKGVHAFFSAKDLSDDQNLVGPVFHDEEVFAKTTVNCQGQTIGAIVADNQSLAQRAARMVKVEYEELSPIIVTIEDAIAHNSYFPGYPKTIIKGDVENEFKKADHVIEGSCRIGGQEHFYLETHVSLAIPRDSDELELFCSSQHPSEVQKLVSHILSVPSCKIVTRVKRLGGGFGGKESRGILVALPCALAAYKLRRPVRCMLDRDEDMLITGTRHPFYFKYKTACTNEGKITACEIECYNNAGYSMDLSFSVLERAMFHFENSYLIPNVRVIGYVCKTNLPSNTAFRGFGGPQGMFAGEHIIRDVARVTGRNCVDVALLNMYKEGDLTHYNQKLENCCIRRCWEECIKQSNFYNQRKAVEEFNKQNQWKKRGLSIVPTKFGIAFTALHLNQAGALVHIYQDGSVLISHGGTEMGQGLHTKVIQIAAKVFEIPIEFIHVSESSTDKVPNTSATAASVGSDINGMAVLNACRKLNKRLQPVKQKFPNENWKKWISYAYLDRISLSATGFYKIPDIGYSFETNSGNPFSYFTYGVGCSLVEIDCLTGDHQVLRTDIVMDVGSSLNPAIDIGQIEGAFMQGYGLFTLEEMIYSPAGIVISRGPGMYKLPGFADIPTEFNVSLLTGSKNPRAVFSSKAIGEPPLFLASSVFFAIKEAISAARKSQNMIDHFNLISPATSARIRMACEDNFTQKISEPKKGTFIPWNVMP